MKFRFVHIYRYPPVNEEGKLTSFLTITQINRFHSGNHKWTHEWQEKSRQPTVQTCTIPSDFVHKVSMLHRFRDKNIGREYFVFSRTKHHLNPNNQLL